MEAVSVILQVASFKMTGKRIFRMAPIHHHFELKGWAEPKVIVRFWIITIVLVLVGLATSEGTLKHATVSADKLAHIDRRSWKDWAIGLRVIYRLTMCRFAVMDTRRDTSIWMSY